MACTYVNQSNLDPHTPLNHTVALKRDNLALEVAAMNEWLASDEAHGICTQVWEDGASVMQFTDPDTAFSFKIRFG